MQIQINSFNELLELIESNTLSKAEVIEVIETALNVFICPDEVENISENIKDYWNEFGHLPTGQRPLFLKCMILEDAKKIPKINKIIEDIEKRY